MSERRQRSFIDYVLPVEVSGGTRPKPKPKPRPRPGPPTTLALGEESGQFEVPEPGACASPWGA
jgi:hypothetical protein